MKKIIRFSLFICLALFFSCKKEKGSIAPPPAELHFSSEGLQYIQLKEGAYFIYKDSATGLEDSIVVSTSYLKSQISPAHTETGPVISVTYPEFTFDKFTLILTEPKVSNRTWFHGETQDLTGSLFSQSQSVPILMADLVNSLVVNPCYVFSFPADSISTIDIEGITYTNVIKTIGEVNYGEGNPDNIYETTWWSKGVGIIKWQIKTNNKDKTFILIRHG